MDRDTRQYLKHDQFAEKVGESVQYVGLHRRQVLMIAVGVIALVAIILGYQTYRNRAHEDRQAALKEALALKEGVVSTQGPPPGAPPDIKVFPTEQAKTQASIKAFSDLAERLRGTDEGTIARYYLATTHADTGNVAEAEKHLRLAAEAGGTWSSQAKLALSQILQGTNRQGDAEKLLNDLIANPTALVSKEQATIALARLKADKNPAEARKLLEPLRTERPGVSRVAITALSELPPATK